MTGDQRCQAKCEPTRWTRHHRAAEFDGLNVTLLVVSTTSAQHHQLSRLPEGAPPAAEASTPRAPQAHLNLSASSGVRGGVDLTQRVHRDQGVDLRGGHRSVPEELLHHADVRAALEQVGGERVPQGVRGRSEEHTSELQSR